MGDFNEFQTLIFCTATKLVGIFWNFNLLLSIHAFNELKDSMSIVIVNTRGGMAEWSGFMMPKMQHFSCRWALAARSRFEVCASASASIFWKTTLVVFCCCAWQDYISTLLLKRRCVLKPRQHLTRFVILIRRRWFKWNFALQRLPNHQQK